MKKPESKLQELVTRLQQACGENLVSIVLYGSAAREDFHEEFSLSLIHILGVVDGGGNASSFPRGSGGGSHNCVLSDVGQCSISRCRALRQDAARAQANL